LAGKPLQSNLKQTNAVDMMDYEQELKQFFRQTQPDAQISPVQKIAAGWENEIYAFTLVADGQSRDLILRVFPGQGALGKAEREFRGMRHLYGVGFPVPEVIALESTRFERPAIIMERIPGQTLGQVLAQAAETEQAEYVARICTLFARLHEQDWRPLVGHPEPYTDENAANRLLLERYRQIVAQTGMNCALPVVDWVAAQTLPLKCPQPSIVHQDFHPENLLWTGHDLKVIDWTAIGVYDRRIDIAWTLLLAGASEGTAVRDQLLQLYENAAGIRIQAIEIFEALACVRRFNDLWQALRQGGASWGLRPETVTAMRSQAANYEQQYVQLRTITGLRIPEIEELLTEIARPQID